jgi:pilus assembly protein CpaC
MSLAALRLAKPCRWRCRGKTPNLASLLVTLILWLGAWPGPGPRPVLAAPLQDQQTISVPINKSRVLDLREHITRVSVANPAIADILVINPKQLYINGKELGATNMILWDDKDQVKRQIGLEVTHDLESLKEKLYRALPGERVRVESTKDAIVLSGTASSPERMASAMTLAGAYSEKVINLLQVGGAQQVLLEVKVAEVNRTLGKSLDSSFLGIYDGGSVKIGLSNNWQRQVTNPNQDYSIGDIVDNLTNTGIASLINSGNFSAALFLQMAEEDGQARILAEPNLTTLSGQEAEFLSGGTFWITSPATATSGNTPVPVDFGVKLKFIPFVMDSGLINLKVNVSVSEPGPPTLSGGAENQSLLSRGANATVEVPSGQVIAIAGLLSERSRKSLDQFPGLGDIPILGTLFRSQSFQKEQTELVIFVTPRLANSYAPQQAKLPAGDFVEPSNLDFYLMGKMNGQRPAPGPEGKAKANSRQGSSSPASGTEGAFGHDL